MRKPRLPSESVELLLELYDTAVAIFDCTGGKKWTERKEKGLKLCTKFKMTLSHNAPLMLNVINI